MRIKNFILLALIFVTARVFSQNNTDTLQTSFSLQQAIDYAIANSVVANNANLELEKSRHFVTEQVAAGLPQINASVQYDYNIASPVFIFPDFQSGNPNQFTALEVAPLNTATARASASMLLLNGRYFIGLKAAKSFLEVQKDVKTKSLQDIKVNIMQSYYTALIAAQNVQILDSSLVSLKQSVYETEQLYKQGFTGSIDVEQLQLTLATTQDRLLQAKNSLSLAVLALKYQMGYPLDKSIQLTDKLQTFTSTLKIKETIASLPSQLNVSQNINFILAEGNLELTKYDYKRQKAAAYPSLSTNISIAGNFFNNERFLFFDDATQSTLGGVVWGFTLNIPIFSSWGYASKVKQKKIEVMQSKNNLINTKNRVQLGYLRAKKMLENNYLRFKNAKSNYELAAKIRKTNTIKYQEGLLSSLALTQSEQQYFQALQTYYETLFNVLDAKITLEKIMGNFLNTTIAK